MQGNQEPSLRRDHPSWKRMAEAIALMIEDVGEEHAKDPSKIVEATA